MFRLSFLLAWLCSLPATSLLAGGVVTGATDYDLRSKLAGGGLVTFQTNYAITLTNTLLVATNTTIDAGGNTISISGSNAHRIFNVNPRVGFQLLGVTVSSGRDTNGGALYIGTGAQVLLSNCVLSANSALAVLPTNITVITNTVVTNQVATYPTNFFVTNLFVYNGVFSYLQGPSTNTVIFTNSASLPAGEVFTNTFVYTNSFNFVTNNTTYYTNVLGTNITYFTNLVTVTNYAVALDGKDGGDSDRGNGGNGSNGRAGTPAYGGAIFNRGVLALYRCALSNNTAQGGYGGHGGAGGNGALTAGRGGNGGAGALAGGGAVYNLGTVSLVACDFYTNSASGGSGGTGGSAGSGIFAGRDGGGGGGGVAYGGAVYSLRYLSNVSACTFRENRAIGAVSQSGGMQSNGNGSSGKKGGDALGGAVANTGRAAFTNCTFFDNTAEGGGGGDGGNGRVGAGNGGNGGNAVGGSLHSAGTIMVVNCTFSDGAAVGGTNGLAGSGLFSGSDGNTGGKRGGNVARAGGRFTVRNSIVGKSRWGPGGYGKFVDGDYNLSQDTSIALGKSHSRKSIDPKLSTLADNGGPTRTIALSADSPAIDQVPAALAPATDQRGVPRPVGSAADIGAYEVSSPAITLQPTNQAVLPGGNVLFAVAASGAAPLSYQWSFNSVALARGTNASLSITNVQPGDAGSYVVVVSNSYGSVTSAVAQLSVNQAPVITRQPDSQVVSLGSNAVFTVVAQGSPAPTYRWSFAGTNLPAATNSDLTLTNVQLRDVGTYRVLVTNQVGAVTSQPAQLRVWLPARMTNLPLTTNGFTFLFPVQTDLTYVVEYKNDLSETSWFSLSTNRGTAGTALVVTNPVSSAPARFFRVRVQ